jgi:hypothetical protein
MLTIFGPGNHCCDRISRRNFLQVGALGLGGLGLADLLRLRAAEPTAPTPKSVIIIHMLGGPSQNDSYDMKPKAPVEYRGELQPIATNVPGIEICELMPRQARMMDKIAIVRDLQFHNELPNDHDPQEIFTGFAPKYKRPPMGAIVSRFWPPKSALPPYISLCKHDKGMLQRVHPEDPLYVGAAHRPFEPVSGDLSNLQMSIELPRLNDRTALLRSLDTLRCGADQRKNLEGLDGFTQRALAMVTSPQVLGALDISQEPAHIRERYGPDYSYYPTSLPGSTPRIWPTTQFLIARRLVEAGVPVVTMSIGNWDHHGVLSNGPQSGIFPRLREELPWFDKAFSALISDLDERGLLSDVAVVAWGEMGRTPRINRQAGRDHWQESGFALLAGGGMKCGQAIGATDPHGARPRGNPHTPQHVFANLYRVLGINTAMTLPDFSGRPQFLLDDREPISQLL